MLKFPGAGAAPKQAGFETLLYCIFLIKENFRMGREIRWQNRLAGSYPAIGQQLFRGNTFNLALIDCGVTVHFDANNQI